MGDLLWGTRQPATKGPKRTLELERIIAEAIDIADTQGLAALSMNALAARLGVGTMSLYRYVASKDELLELILDEAIGPPPAFEARSGWRQRFRQWAALTLEIYDRHPWVLQAVPAARRMGPNELAWGELAFQAAQAAGAQHQDLMKMANAVNSFVRGAAQMAAKPEYTPRLDLEAMDGLDNYPMLARAIEVDQGSPAQWFDFGLERVLDGIELYLKGRK